MNNENILISQDIVGNRIKDKHFFHNGSLYLRFFTIYDGNEIFKEF